MTYLYTKLSQDNFTTAFVEYGRRDQFSYKGRVALFDYLESLAEDLGKPIQLDVIALCCEYTEYTSIEEFNAERDSEYGSWNDVADNGVYVIKHSNGAAIVREL